MRCGGRADTAEAVGRGARKTVSTQCSKRRQQIAGDLMPAKSIEDRAAKITATGFLMVGDCEIVNPDKAKMETDHIDTQVIKIGQAFLGMTLGCARCHDHKFDPIGLEDYYAIAGTLRSSPSSHKMPDMGVWSALNTTDLPETPAQLATRKKLEAETEQRTANLKAERKKLTDEKAAVEKQLAAVGSPIDSGKPQIAIAAAGSPRLRGPATDNAERDIAKTPEANPTKIQSVAVPESAGGKPDKASLTKRRDELNAQITKLAGDIQHAEYEQAQSHVCHCGKLDDVLRTHARAWRSALSTAAGGAMPASW